MRNQALALLAGALLASCASTPAPAEPKPSEGARLTMPAGADIPIDAPKAGPVARDLRAGDSGKTILVRVGDRLSVSLVGTPTAGYIWAAPSPPAFLKLDGQSSGPTHSAQLKPGFTGGDHWEVTIFTAIAPGKGVLRFEQRRPWETTTPPAAVWSATIEAR